MCRAESHIVPSTSSCYSITCFRDLRRACICVSPQRDGWGLFSACHREGGRSRKKQGPADGAPRRRARFDVAVRRVHRTTRRDRIDQCVGTWRVLSRRKCRPWPRTPVHKGALYIKREGRRRKRTTRGRAKRSNSCGRPRGSAFASSDQPSGGRSRRVGRKSSGTPSRRNRSQASKRKRRGSHCETDSTKTSGGRRRSDALYHKKVLPENEPKTVELTASRPMKKRLSIAPTSCLSGERASERPRGTGVRPVNKAQDAHDSHRTDHGASNAPEGSQVQAKSKAQQENKDETENDIIFSEEDEKCYKFGHGDRGPGSRAKQRSKGRIEAVPRGAPQVLSPEHWKPSGDEEGHPGSTGRSMAAGICSRFGQEILRQDYNEEVLRSQHQCRDESIGGGDGLVDGWPCGASGRHQGSEAQTQTGVRACSESGNSQTLNEEPPMAHPRLPPKRGWLRDLPAKGPLPQHGVYIGRSHGPFYQPQG